MPLPSHEAATGAAYDHQAQRYTDFATHHHTTHPLHRALIPAFTDLADPARPVADLGCGPGHVCADLHTRGLRVLGLDVSARLLAHARHTHPGPAFVRASMRHLPLAPSTLGGILAHYSLIHTPPDQVPETFTEWARVLAPGGPVLVSFQSQEPGTHTEPFDHAVAPAHRHSPEHLVRAAGAAGLSEAARLLVHPSQDLRRGWAQMHLLLQLTTVSGRSPNRSVPAPSPSFLT
ncbi:class I SAM-dependent methyltransferase [Nocardiopsis salina]|uniref:class I SAM-dependent methyltransferase n=1 Tax=Nocardiopsis salina TaxID=245836 RepID=UPI000349B739|nr:class I SAM-dependent methyltransferase [Nocardiopsis salina]